MRMVHWIHYNSTDLRSFTQVPRATRLAKTYLFVIEIPDLTNRCPASIQDHAYLAGRKFDLHVSLLFCHQLSIGAGSPNYLAALSNFHLHVMNHGPERNILQRQTIPGLDIRPVCGDDWVANLQTVRPQDVGFASVYVINQSYSGASVWIVLHTGHYSGDIDLASFEVQNTE